MSDQQPLPQEPNEDILKGEFLFRWIFRFYHHVKKLSRNYERPILKSANYTATPNDCFIIVDTTSGNVTITLPAQIDITDGKKYVIKKIDSSANIVTIVTADSASFKGESIIRWKYDTITVIADGTDWQVSEYNYTEITAFTPELWDDTLATDSTPPTYAIATGHAVRQKNMITIALHIKLTAIGSLTTTQAIRVGGIPMALSSDVSQEVSTSIGYINNFHASVNDPVSGVISSGNKYIDLYKLRSNSTTTALLVSDFSSDGEIMISATHEV